MSEQIFPANQNVEIIFLALQVLQVLFLWLHDWIPLGRLNDVTAVRSQDTTTRLIIVTLIQSVHRQRCGNPLNGPIFANQARNPLDLNACYQRQMKYLLKSAGLSWHGWHGFRRALASNLNRLGIDDW